MKHFCCMCLFIKRQYEAHQTEIFSTLLFPRFQASESQASQRVDHRPLPLQCRRCVALPAHRRAVLSASLFFDCLKPLWTLSAGRRPGHEAQISVSWPMGQHSARCQNTHRVIASLFLPLAIAADQGSVPSFSPECTLRCHHQESFTPHQLYTQRFLSII